MKIPLHLVFQAREGVVMVSVVHCNDRYWEENPLHLVFQVREGAVMVWGSIEEKSPSISHFERGRGQSWYKSFVVMTTHKDHGT